MIEKLILGNQEKISLSKFTVLVGPNNVGKSQTLRDIYNIFYQGKGIRTVIVKDVLINRPQKFDDLLQTCRSEKNPTDINAYFVKGILPNLISGESLNLHLDEIRRRVETEGNIDAVFGNISRFMISYLDAESRLKIARTAETFNAGVDPPQNLFQALYLTKGSELEKLRKAFKESFDLDLYFDYSSLRNFMLRVGDKFEDISKDPQEAFPILNKYSKIDEQGDGYRSFVGVVLSLLLSQGRVVLLDEPEAFLHPAQARQLGAWIATYTKDSTSQIIVATHNSNFLSGILSTGQPVDIFRLNRKGKEETKFTHISSTSTNELAKSPILSSQRVLEAIFHKGVIVCEADADRAIYQIIAAMWLNKQDILFIHAHNKQTIHKVIRLLYGAEIPAVAITDIDLLDSESDLEKIIDSLGGNNLKAELLALREEIASEVNALPDEESLNRLKLNIKEFHDQLERKEHTMSGARGALNRLRKEANTWGIIKEKGLVGFPVEVRKKAELLVSIAKQINLFIVPVGELEGWFDLGTTQKNKWIIEALEKIYAGEHSESLKSFIEEAINKIYSEAN